MTEEEKRHERAKGMEVLLDQMYPDRNASCVITYLIRQEFMAWINDYRKGPAPRR